MHKIFLLSIVVVLGSSTTAHAQYGGDPYRIYTDQMVRDHINLRRTAATHRSASRASSQRKSKGHFSQSRSPRSTAYQHLAVPTKSLQIKGLSYDAARKKIIAAGWQPCVQQRSYQKSPNIQGGNGLVFWKRGYSEITDSSGTGNAFCRFKFQDAKGSILTVVTAGEEDPNGTSKAVVNNYSVATHSK